MLATITPSCRGGGQDGGLMEFCDEVFMMTESPSAQALSLFVGEVALHPPEMISCDMTVPAGY